MLYRIMTGLAALFIGALAVGLPIMLTEAGTSTSTSETRALNASFEYVDPATGDLYYGTMYASLSAGTQRTNDNGGGGSAGSGRANSGRPSGGNSQRPGGGSTYTYVSNDVSLYIDRYPAGGGEGTYGDGYTQDATIIIAGDLSSGSVRGTVPFSFWTGSGYEETSVEVNLAFTATGPLVTSRERYSSHIKSPRQSDSYMTTTARRNAIATGRFVVGDGFTGGSDVNVAANASYYAEIATYESKGRSSY